MTREDQQDILQLANDYLKLTEQNNRLREALHKCKEILYSQAEKGYYPEMCFQHNGGEGLMFIDKALEQELQGIKYVIDQLHYQINPRSDDYINSKKK